MLIPEIQASAVQGDFSHLELIPNCQQLLMDSIDFNFGIEDVGVAVLQEMWNSVALQAMEVASETRDVILGKESLHEFSKSISELSSILHELDVNKIEAAIGSEATKTALETLNCQLTKACKIIRNYKSGSRLRLLFHSHSTLLQMQGLTKEIATTISSFCLVNLNTSVNIRARINGIVKELRSMEFRSASGMETIASEIENSVSQNRKNRDHSMKLLKKVAEAVGVNANASLVEKELTLLKQEKEEMEDQKKHAEALQLAQLMQLLYSTEIVTRPQNADISMHNQQFAINSFTCSLSKAMMTDPVAIFCGHSFEREAIQECFSRGRKSCPTCGEELPSLELTPNTNLLRSIDEWKQRDRDLRFQAAVSGINSNEHLRQNKALEDMQFLMAMPQYAVKAAEEGLIPTLVVFLKDDTLNTAATLTCLYLLAKHCDNHKELQEAIVEAGVIRRILKQIYKGEKVLDAVAVLLELSKLEALGDKIGNTKDCIPVLVSLLDNRNKDILEKVQNILLNLSANTSFVIKMAEAGHFQPFVARFNQGPQESRSRMAADLVEMQLKENSIKELKDRQFIHNLLQMLSSNSPAYKSACLRCIKKLLVYPKIAKRLLSDNTTVPLLLGLISFVRSDPDLKKEAGEVLTLLVGASQHPQFEMYQGFQELQSEHNVCLFLKLADSSSPNIRIQFLHLLVGLSYKSETARNLLRSDSNAVVQLFSMLEEDSREVKRLALKLIYCISDGQPDGVPLPPSPRKEAAINNLVAILTSSLHITERSTAAAIISQLPKEDMIIDDMLQKSEALKAIAEVICSTQEEINWFRAPPNIDPSLLENALAALLQFTEPTKPKLQREVRKLELYPSLIRVLSKGSPIAKKHTATALTHLSQSTGTSIPSETNISNQPESFKLLLHVMKLFPISTPWCCSTSSNDGSSCSVHGATCSSRHAFCLVKEGAVKPLVRTLSETESGVAEAALTALETLLTDHSTTSHANANATAAIVDSEGVTAILQVLEKGDISAKSKALDLFHKIIKHTKLTDPLFQRSERILIQLLNEDTLKKRVALVLRQMSIIPEQSSYF